TLITLALFFKLWQKPLLEPPSLCARMYGEFAPLHACNVYGLFASITTSRYEVIIEELHLVEAEEIEEEGEEANSRHPLDYPSSAPPTRITTRETWV
ncbi:lipase maturation, partial [Cystoisospora suis]